MEKAIEVASQCLKKEKLDAFEVFAVAEDSLVIEVRRQMLENFNRSRGRGLAVRIVRDGRMGFATTTDTSDASVHKAVSQAVEAMECVGVSEEAVIPAKQGSVQSIEDGVKRELTKISDDDKIAVAMALESAAISTDNRISYVQHPRYEERTREVWVANSTGVYENSKRGIAVCELKVVAADGDESQGAFDFSFSPCFDSLDARKLAKHAASLALKKLGGKQVEGGRKRVIIENGAASEMVKLIAQSFFADNVQRGKSIIQEKLGQSVYSPLVTIVDDGLLPGGYGSFSFDAEGVPKRRTMMVQEGEVTSWLYDGARAARAGVESTGNCVRDDLRRPPAIGVGNCFLKSGSNSMTEMLGMVADGVYVTDLLGTHTANPISGDFSFGAEGFVVTGGVKGDPVRGITLAGNVHDLFKQIACVGDDLRFMGSYGSPSVLVDGLMLGGG
jgi:PmbA protein